MVRQDNSYRQKGRLLMALKGLSVASELLQLPGVACQRSWSPSLWLPCEPRACWPALSGEPLPPGNNCMEWDRQYEGQGAKARGALMPGLVTVLLCVITATRECSL